MESPPLYENTVYQPQFYAYKDVATWPSTSSTNLWLMHKESQSTSWSWVFTALVTPFICISAARIHNHYEGRIHNVYTPFGVFVMVYSYLVLAICIPVSMRHYHHRYMCARYHCGTPEYIRRILSTAREFLFLFPCAAAEIIALSHWLSTLQSLHLELFLRGVQAFLCVSLVIMNYKSLRDPIKRMGLWTHGKAISLMVALVATLAVYLAVENVDGTQLKDAKLIIAGMVLVGMTVGLVVSLVGDWVVLHALKDYSLLRETLRSHREGGVIGMGGITLPERVVHR